MTRTEELMKLCDGSTIFAAVLQEELKQLVELCRLQHVALKEYTAVCRSHNDPNDFTPRVVDEGFHARDAIAAFNRFEKGGE